MSGRVAVIAVHGVADQPPFATARAVADLLKCQLADGVSDFREEPLRLEVQPLRAASEAQPQQAPAAQQPTPETRGRVRGKPTGFGNSSRELALATQWETGVKLSCDSREATLEYFEPRQIADDRQQPEDATFSPDEIDRKIMLTILEKYNGGPVGLSTVAASIDEEADTIAEVYEPYLIQLGFIQITPRGRMGTDRAYQYFNVRRHGGGPGEQPTLFS